MIEFPSVNEKIEKAAYALLTHYSSFELAARAALGHRQECTANSVGYEYWDQVMVLLLDGRLQETSC